MVDKPRRNAGAVKATKTLQSSHGHADRKFLKAYRALGVVDAVLLRRDVGIHARPSRSRRKCRILVSGSRAAVRAVRLDARGNVRFPVSLEACKLS